MATTCAPDGSRIGAPDDRPPGDRPPPAVCPPARPEDVLTRCHRMNRERIAGELAQARSGGGPTVSEILTEIFEEQAPGTLRRR